MHANLHKLSHIDHNKLSGRLLIDDMHDSWGRFRSGPCAIYTPEIQLTISPCRCSHISYPPPQLTAGSQHHVAIHDFCVMICRSLVKNMVHGRSTLQVCQRGGWVLFWLLPHLTTKERPRHVYSDLKPPEQIIGHKITYNVITSSFEVESWRHTTLWTVRCDGEHTVARS